MAMYLGSNKVEIGQSSGGGSSDFSTAEVTITISNENVTVIRIPIACINEDFGETADSSISTSGTYSAILYKGKAIAAIEASVPPFMLNISVTGDIEYDDDLVITGNGTITIS